MKFEFIKKNIIENQELQEYVYNARGRIEERQRLRVTQRTEMVHNQSIRKTKRKKWALGVVTSIVLFFTFGVRWIGGIYEDNMLNGMALHTGCTGPISFFDYWGHGMIVTLVWLTGIALIAILGFLLFILYNAILDE